MADEPKVGQIVQYYGPRIGGAIRKGIVAMVLKVYPLRQVSFARPRMMQYCNDIDLSIQTESAAEVGGVVHEGVPYQADINPVVGDEYWTYP